MENINKKIYFVYKTNFKVLEDYVNSLNIFYDYIELENINKYYNCYDIFIFGQMWLGEQEKSFYEKTNILFLNVEHLTESNRLNHIINHIKHNMPIIDFSMANILFLRKYIEQNNIDYKSNLILLPYQFNSIENFNIQNNINEYEYDIGIINAITKKDKTNDSNLIYKRDDIWQKIKQQNWTYINILGWGKERDTLIKKCKIIINIHNFDVFNIFEHIRCDRLIFANKIILSDKSLYQDQLDINDYVIWEEYDKIIDTAQDILNNFNKYNVKKDFIKIINSRKKTLKNNIDKILDISSVKNWYNKYGANIIDIDKRLSQYHRRINIKFGNFNDELVEQKLIIKYISPDDIVLEIGGNIGRTSCLLATILNNEKNLLVFECDKLSYLKLLENKLQNHLNFNVENKALSINDLYQVGWNTYTNEEIKLLNTEISSQLTKIECISYDDIINKYKLKFNTLIIDCEGAFYYIIQSFPNILKNINKIIIENDYPNWERKEFVEKILEKNNFKTVETIPLDEKWYNFHPDKLIRDNFYQYKIKM